MVITIYSSQVCPIHNQWRLLYSKTNNNRRPNEEDKIDNEQK